MRKRKDLDVGLFYGAGRFWLIPRRISHDSFIVSPYETSLFHLLSSWPQLPLQAPNVISLVLVPLTHSHFTNSSLTTILSVDPRLPALLPSNCDSPDRRKRLNHVLCKLPGLQGDFRLSISRDAAVEEKLCALTSPWAQ